MIPRIGRIRGAMLVGAVSVFFVGVAALGWHSPTVIEQFASVVGHGVLGPPPTVLVRDVRVLGPPEWTPSAPSQVTIEHGRIVAISSVEESPLDDSARIITAGGRVMTAGLVDAESELVFRDASRRPLPPQVVRDSLRAQVRSGVTSVRDLGSPVGAASRLRASLGRTVLGPSAELGGAWLEVPGTGEPGWDRFRHPTERRLLASSQDVIEALDRAQGEGATWLAVRTPAHVDSGPSRSVLDCLAREAGQRRLRLAVRVVDEPSLRWALGAGASSLEGLASYPEAIPDELVEWIAASRTSVVPLAHLARVGEIGSSGEYELDRQTRWIGRASRWGELALLDRAIRARHEPAEAKSVDRARMERFRANLARLASAGAPIALGTGAPAPFAFPERPSDEIDELANAGLGGRALLETNTSSGRRLLAGEDTPAAVAIGAPADLVIWDCDPSGEPRCYQKPKWVIAGGRVVEGRPTEPARPFL